MSCVNLISPKIMKASPIVKIVDKVFCNPKKFDIEVVNDHLFRSSEVPLERIPLLAQIGIKRVVNLRSISKKQIEKLTKEYQKYNIEFCNLPVDMFNFKKSIPDIIQLAKDKKTTLFHCTYGNHRTGGVIAIERSITEQLPMAKAIEDMYKHGFKRIHKILLCSIKNGLNKFEKLNQS